MSVNQSKCRMSNIECRITKGGWMTSFRLTLVTLLFVPTMAAQQPTPAAPRPTPPASPADVSSIDAILAALYDVISGPAGQARNWDRFRSLFVPGARLIPARPKPDGGAEAVVMDVEGYISRTSRFFEQNGFFERELARKTEQF